MYVSFALPIFQPCFCTLTDVCTSIENIGVGDGLEPSNIYRCYVSTNSNSVFIKQRSKIWGFAVQIKSFCGPHLARGPYVVHACFIRKHIPARQTLGSFLQSMFALYQNHKQQLNQQVLSRYRKLFSIKHGCAQLKPLTVLAACKRRYSQVQLQLPVKENTVKYSIDCL